MASFVVTCAALKCHFDASGSTDDVGIVAWTWDWADGQKQARRDPITNHTYVRPGRYEVVLTVTDASGQKGRAVRKFTLAP